ncbi:hypothetical protein C7974DRAFT_328219, partial [Boeremia exigua]|uniref:uncharacterized protein n=1 Tax=Boeremia exigua TaxID=749465 RepID=UPI001E8CC2C4
MSYMLEFPPGPPLPQSIDSPPYVVFAINGTDVTPSLPPRIPLKLVLHFAPALQKWVLPTPEPAYLPPDAVRQDLQTPQIGIDVQARIETVGLVWVITCMLQRSGRTAPFNTLSLHPDLDTSLAIHDAWLALGLPRAGLDALHTHLHVQLMMRVSPVSLWDVQMIWHTFPHNSQIVRAMGINFIEGLINQEYKLETSLAILAWMRSTPELTAFLKYIQDAVPKF